ncbi:MAG: hypothetical protein JWO62_1177 [Acidimicrobiaceae bacterium]|nr:hypothetical protein [Acidimicrobiaceae bacterium]
MTTISIACSQSVVTSGPNRFPLYVGFCKANDLASLAAAPSFTSSTSNDVLARSAATPPVREWQRPIDQNRVAAMAATFSKPGELMPNPVLLSENPNRVGGSVKVSPLVVGNGTLTGFWNVEITVPSGTSERPLWILDGQHRIAALASSTQQASEVPVVFMIDDGSGVYNSATFAKLFAQVTTEAKKLDTLHAEWLTYAFLLGEYAPQHPRSSQAIAAMTTVIDLCRTPTLSSGANNPFFGQIQFNSDPARTPNMPAGGFEYTCIELKSILQSHYFGRTMNAAVLPPNELAEEISLAYEALRKSVSNAPTSVFFGSSSHQQRIMQEAYLAGVLQFLASHGTPVLSGKTWDAVLSGLNFQATNWDFSWVLTLNGVHQTRSKKIAIDVFREVFRTQALPGSSPTLADHLRGNAAGVTLEASYLTGGGKRATARSTPAVTQGLVAGNRLSFVTGGRTHLRVSDQISNVADIEVIDKASGPLNTKYPAIVRSGMRLDATIMRNPLELLILMHHYGGTQSHADVSVQF